MFLRHLLARRWNNIRKQWQFYCFLRLLKSLLTHFSLDIKYELISSSTVNTTPLIVVSCSQNIRRNSVHSTGDSSLFDQNNCPIKVLKREKSFQSDCLSLYFFSDAITGYWKKSYWGKKWSKSPPVLCTVGL